MTTHNTTSSTERTPKEEIEAAQATPFKQFDFERVGRALDEFAEDARDLAREIGLDPYPVRYWIVDNDEMNQLISYGGFQTRYPHWRWGMSYDRQRKTNQYLGGKAFEIVNNDNPSHAFLQASNSLADQKAVITHVEAHSDFFKNNQWFATNPNAASMLETHADRIQSFIEDPDIGREAVESWIDTILTIEDNINQYASEFNTTDEDVEEADTSTIEERVSSLGFRETIENHLFDEEWFESQQGTDKETLLEEDLLAYFFTYGKQYDEEKDRAVDYEGWQLEILEMLRRESLYFAPQKMTKVMNEGWASFHESLMMADEGFADDDEFIEYADHQSQVLNSPGFNPYKLGKALWDYIENTVNRREVVDKLLRVDGVTPKNFHSVIDFRAVQRELTHPTSKSVAKRHFSLSKPQNAGFIKRMSLDDLEVMARYILEESRYSDIEEALQDVNYAAGWERMREIRASHNDITFIDSYLSPEFVQEQQYFTYEFNQEANEFQIASKQADDVKKKLLLNLTNFGKPTITVADRNYNNSNELLLEHQYNGVMLDIKNAENTLENIFELWGRPVTLRTIINPADPDKEEHGYHIRYNGDSFTKQNIRWSKVEHLAAADVDYNTKPDEWL